MNKPMSSSVRWIMYVTLSLSSGWTSQIAAAAERAVQDAVQQPAAQHVKQQVRRVVAAHVEPAYRVVDRQRQANRRSSRHAGARGRTHRMPDRPEAPQVWVVRDRHQVVEE